MRPTCTAAAGIWACIILATSGGWTTDKAPFHEWSLETPSGHLIDYSDRYLSDYGVCLRGQDRVSVIFYEPVIYVAHLDRWQAYPGHVVGHARDGYFVFNTQDTSVIYYDQPAALDAAVQELGFTTPAANWVTPATGWAINWALLHLAQRERVIENWAARYIQQLPPEAVHALSDELGATETDQPWLHEVLAAAVIETYPNAFCGPRARALLTETSDAAQLTQLEDRIDALAAKIEPHAGSPTHFLQFVSRKEVYAAAPEPPDKDHDPLGKDCPGYAPLTTRLPGHTARIACFSLLLEHINRARPEPGTMSTFSIDSNSRALIRRRHLPPHELTSPLAQVRSQLELAKMQHGVYPDLTRDGWAGLTQTTFPDADYRPAPPDAEGTVGPYLNKPPANPLARHAQEDPTSVATDTSAAWQYDPDTGDLRAVVTMVEDRFEQEGLTTGDFIRIDPPPR